MLGYMLTWTTYGSWLQGDRRGWVKDGKIFQPDTGLEHSNQQNMKTSKMILSKEQKEITYEAICNESIALNQKIFAHKVCSNHVHIVAETIDLAIGRVVSHYKNAVRLTLQDNGFDGKLWTKGFDKRYCINDEELNARIQYVRNHKS